MRKFWKWYDSLNEPWRFLFMIVILCTPLHIYSFTNQPLYLIAFIPLVISRAKYLNKSN